MSAPTVERPDHAADETRPATSWDRLLVISAAAVAIADIVFLALIVEVIPFLVVAAALTAIGIGLMRVRRTAGIVVIALTSVVMVAGSVPFAIDHLGHPESGIDWLHALISVFGRVFVLGVAVAAWRGLGESAARLTGVLAVGVVGVIATVALVATAVTSGDERQAGDIELVVDATAFPDQIVVGSGDVLYVDNTHIFRHTFTVEGTNIDVELPALQATRIPIDLPAGTYDVICDVPGHDSMTTVLVVE